MAHAGPSTTFGRPVTFFDGRDSRATMDDGRVFFDSPDRLVTADTNSVGDVYEYTPGSGLSAAEPGTSGEPASFGDVSEDGRDVFFVTGDRLGAAGRGLARGPLHGTDRRRDRQPAEGAERQRRRLQRRGLPPRPVARAGSRARRPAASCSLRPR